MNKSFVALMFFCLGIISVSISAQEPSSSPSRSAGEERDANESSDEPERCDCPPSPDGTFAFLTSDTEDSFGDQLQILDLIDKKSGKKLQRIDDAVMPVLWNVLWAPDSNGFALKTKVVGHPRLQGVDVYFRSGGTFQKIELPNVPELPDLPAANIAKEVVWSPDSKRFALNYTKYSPTTDYETVVFFQLRGDKWVALHSPAGASQPNQLLQLPLKDHLPKGFDPRHCAPEWDEVKLRTWTDANTAILYTPCYDRSRDLKAAFLFTLKFDDAGNWRIVKTQQMSKKELEEEE
jgi:hypothetical protein